jgi:hypothetical protein
LPYTYGWLYRKEKNLFVLGLFHGWLGALLFYTVVGRDVWEEFFATVLSEQEVLRSINIVGLAFDVIGAVVMFLNSPFASSKPPIVSGDPISVSGDWHARGKKIETRKIRLLHVGFWILITGLALQLLSAISNEAIDS